MPILLLLARLGLRSSEVAFLELDDIDWNTGTLRVRAKGGMRNELPLSREIGEAIAAYLSHGRPLSASRRVFLRAKAPIRGFRGPSGIGSVVRHALQRAGMEAPSFGTHQFRHGPGHRDAAPGCLTGRDWRCTGSSPSRYYQDIHPGRSRSVAYSGLAMAGRCPMNTLREAVHEYLSMRRHLGFKLRAAGNALLDFTHFMEQRQAPFITETLALAWAQQPKNVRPRALGATVGRRAGLCALSQGHRPRARRFHPLGFLPFRPQRAKPYLYSDEEIRNLLNATLSMPHRYERGALAAPGSTTACSVCSGSRGSAWVKRGISNSGMSISIPQC